MIKVIAGPAKKSRVISDKERRLTAYHESGHAIVMKNLEHHDPVHQISIIPRGAAGGMTISLPNEDKFFMSKSEMFERIISLLGGRVAEKLVLDDISSGASNDIQRATDIARRMVTRYGMSDEIGPIAFGSEHDEVFLGRDLASTRNYSEDVAAKIDREIKKIIDRAYSRCEEILRREIDKLHAVAEYLLEYETMDADTFERYFLTGSFENTDEYEEYKLPNF
jgi:cell division protease FtsH